MAEGSSDDDSIFLTQSTFSQQDENSGDDDPTFGLLPAEYPVFQLTEPGRPYPSFEDISDDDDAILCTAATQIESQSSNTKTSSSIPNEHNETQTPSRSKRIFSDEEMQQMSVRSLADNTQKKIQWAVNLFETWKKERNYLAKFDSGITSIVKNLEDMTKDQLNFCLSRFICEIKKCNGEEYPGQTLYEVIIQIQLYLEKKGKKFRLLNDDEFLQVKNTLDFVMKERSSKGIGTEKKKAETISTDEENLLWEKGALGMNTPKQFMDTIIYLIGLNFALRAASDHRNLRFNKSQLSLITLQNGDEALRYHEDVSKCNQGGLTTRKIKKKIVYCYSNKSNPERCLINYYKTYLLHCPEKKSDNAFYLRPLASAQGDIWFSSVPIGVNYLRGTVARICKTAGLTGYRTNHSLRATAATRLYEAGIDEQLISEVTGHRCTESVREYKRTSDIMRRKANSIVTNSETNAKRVCIEDDNNIHQISKEIKGHSDVKPISITVNINLPK